MSDGTRDPWAELREPFGLDEIELLPKYTGKKENKGNDRRRCDECGGYHDFPCVHLSYVGHAGITDRLNTVDPAWSWEPMAYKPDGTPLASADGMWIRMTVLGKTLPAFGDAQGKTGPNAIKELIGDAIRNGAMRFGVGTYLWSKSDKAKAQLTRDGIEDEDPPAQAQKPVPASQLVDAATLMQIRKLRADIGVDDDLYMQHLEIKHGGPVTADTELSQHEANQLLTQYTTRLKGLEEARKVEEADRLSRVKDELGAEYEEVPF